ncbi:MAG: hypothetical protein JWM92_636 [Candidatus Nomurabacteria bacterium]|jgi:uncharacterized membrane protein|nr:hypothetical protein [Candidatus Nomurabacteria bacterium]
MTYNLHPIFVHFPVAMLFVYSIIKVLPLKKWFPNVAWRDIERVLLVVGVLGAFAALATGDAAEHLVHPNRALVNAHSNFAAIATFIYGALLVGEIAAIINARHYIYGKSWQWISAILQFIETVLCNPIFSGILSALGFIAISITGLLGGTIAYGLTADPVAPFVLKMLGISL